MQANTANTLCRTKIVVLHHHYSNLHDALTPAAFVNATVHMHMHMPTHIHRYNATSQHLLNVRIPSKVGSGLGVAVCEGSVKPSPGDELAVGMLPNQAEPCPPVDLEWGIDPSSGRVVHVDTGLCLTIPPRASAKLEVCGNADGEGQKFVWNAEDGTLQLAPGMFRSGQCLGYVNKTSTMDGAMPMVPRNDGYAIKNVHTPLYNKCAAMQDLYCNASRFRDVLEGYPRCKACLSQHASDLKKDASCTTQQMAEYCGGPVGPAPRVGPNGEKRPPAGAAMMVMSSTDDGLSWTQPAPIRVNNTWGPAYAGNGVAHGVELVADGPHKGRLAMARRYDVIKSTANAFSRSFVLYSDDHGANWVAGDLLPIGWTECQVAELKNGSLLLTSRLGGHGLNNFYCEPWNASQAAQDNNCLQRGFARSDDGGATWSSVWYLEDRQPYIIVNNCEHAMASDPLGSGDLFWGHPGALNMTRANYTVHKSVDGGATWTLLDRVYAHGAGYSDVHVLRDKKGTPYLGALFQRTLYEAGAEGGGYNLALASVAIN